jgi:hypothetical protein
MEMQLHVFLTFALDGPFHASSPLRLGQELVVYPLNRRLGEPFISVLVLNSRILWVMFAFIHLVESDVRNQIYFALFLQIHMMWLF